MKKKKTKELLKGLTILNPDGSWADKELGKAIDTLIEQRVEDRTKEIMNDIASVYIGVERGGYTPHDGWLEAHEDISEDIKKRYLGKNK